MTKIVNACCALYNIALDNGSFNGLCNEENIPQSFGDQHSIIDGPEFNPYYKFGAQVRNEMMKCLSD